MVRRQTAASLPRPGTRTRVCVAIGTALIESRDPPPSNGLEDHVHASRRSGEAEPTGASTSTFWPPQPASRTIVGTTTVTLEVVKPAESFNSIGSHFKSPPRFVKLGEIGID